MFMENFAWCEWLLPTKKRRERGLGRTGRTELGSRRDTKGEATWLVIRRPHAAYHAPPERGENDDVRT